jgi:hypothetical protein
MTNTLMKGMKLLFLTSSLFFGTVGGASAQTVSGSGSSFPVSLYRELLFFGPALSAWNYGTSITGSEKEAFLTGSAASFAGSEYPTYGVAVGNSADCDVIEAALQDSGLAGV